MTRSGGIEDASEAWECAPVALKLQLGDLVFGRVVLKLFRRGAALGELPLPSDHVPSPPPRLTDADGYVVWSQPIASHRPMISWHSDKLVYAPRQYHRYLIKLSGGFEQYMAKFSAKSRSGLRRKLRKYEEASGGATIWREYHTARDLDEFFSLARQVSRKSYQERVLQMGLPADAEFLKSARDLADSDKLRAYLLFMNEEPISYLYCPISDGVVKYDHLGYDPAYSSLSPGTVLQLLALQSLFAEQRFGIFDFTEGEGQHKELFATDAHLCADIYVVHRRFRPLLLVASHGTTEKMSKVAGRLLDGLGIKARVRRLIRTVR